MLCTACPILVHCHSGLVSLWQPRPLTQDSDCLKEKEPDNDGEIITNFLSLPLCTPSPLKGILVKYDRELCCSLCLRAEVQTYPSVQR